MFNIKKLLLINVLTFIPGETQDDPLRIAIDLPEFCRIPKAHYLVQVYGTTCNVALLHNSVGYCFALLRFIMT